MLGEIRYIQNLRSPINSIPNEILTHILEMAVEEETSKTTARDMQTVTSVCRQWRLVTLADPFLWTTIDLGSGSFGELELAQLFLARSKGLPLSFKTHSTGSEEEREKDLKITGIIKAYSARVRALDVAFPEGSAIADFLREISLPEVRDLSINFLGASALSPSLSDAFPSGLPQLRKLSLESFTSWRPAMFVNLTHLHLKSQFGILREIPLAAFLEILELSPALEEIKLRLCELEGDADLERKIHLSHLRTIGLSRVDPTLLFSWITIPPSAKIFIESHLCRRTPPWNLYANDDEFHRFLDPVPVPEDFLDLGLDNPDGMSIIINTPGVTVDIKTTNDGRFEVTEWRDLNDDIFFPGWDDSTLLEGLLESLVRQSFPTVKSLKIGFGYHHPPDVSFSDSPADWEALKEIPNLETLAVHDCVDENLLMILGEGILPHLVTLDLIFHEAKWYSEEGLETLDLCYRMIQDRKKADVPLHHLNICVRRENRDQHMEDPVESSRRAKFERLVKLEGECLERVSFAEKIAPFVI